MNELNESHNCELLSDLELSVLDMVLFQLQSLYVCCVLVMSDVIFTYSQHANVDDSACYLLLWCNRQVLTIGPVIFCYGTKTSNVLIHPTNTKKLKIQNYNISQHCISRLSLQITINFFMNV